MAVISTASARLLLRDGLPAAMREDGKVRFLIELAPEERQRADSALPGRAMAIPLRARRH